jgi:hypothetical protein
LRQQVACLAEGRSEVAEALHVSASWVYKHKDLLGGVRLGARLWRFPEQELMAPRTQPARGSPRPVTEDAGGNQRRPRSTHGSWRLD